jgi:hypothetical protein
MLIYVNGALNIDITVSAQFCSVETVSQPGEKHEAGAKRCCALEAFCNHPPSQQQDLGTDQIFWYLFY